jgi:hypothetical protein
VPLCSRERETDRVLNLRGIVKKSVGWFGQRNSIECKIKARDKWLEHFAGRNE